MRVQGSTHEARRRPPRVTARLLVGAALAAGVGCTAREPRAPEPPPLAASAARAAPSSSSSPSSPSSPSGGTPAPAVASPSTVASPVTVVSDPAVLSALDAQGFDLGTALTGEPAASAADLAGRPPYRALVAAISRDLAEARARDPAAGVGMRFAHRQFDVAWLGAARARFELVGVVNRLDREPFAPEHCGEVRLLYRLSYRVERQGQGGGGFASRLPMTVNVVSFLPRDAAGGCAEPARAWLRPPGIRERGEEATWLVADGPLSPGRRAAWTPKSVEINFQSVRWPATVRPGLGGHAEYVLRVFRRTAGPPWLAPAPLENTPDVGALARDARLRGELAAFLSTAESLSRLDQGTLVVPERFLATRAVSVAPHGLARRANRPFAQLFPASTFASLDLASLESARSPAAVLRRLDALSCPGCHQSRSIAGFHFLGVEPAEDRVDAVEVPMSPHLHEDLERRRAYVAASAAGSPPDPRRPSAERGSRAGDRSAHCGLGDPGFAAWTCGAGLRCARDLDDEVGTCEAAEPAVGDGCEVGTMTPSPDPHRDAATPRARPCAPGLLCEASAVGFPGGMCSGSCDGLSAGTPGATCGGIAVLDAFNACLGRGTPFERCVAEHSRPGALQACDFHTPCRDDYVCARTARASGCIPPYFLFQLRVDGHTR